MHMITLLLFSNVKKCIWKYTHVLDNIMHTCILFQQCIAKMFTNNYHQCIDEKNCHFKSECLFSMALYSLDIAINACIQSL